MLTGEPSAGDPSQRSEPGRTYTINDYALAPRVPHYLVAASARVDSNGTKCWLNGSRASSKRAGRPNTGRVYNAEMVDLPLKGARLLLFGDLNYFISTLDRSSGSATDCAEVHCPALFLDHVHCAVSWALPPGGGGMVGTHPPRFRIPGDVPLPRNNDF